MEVSSEGKVTVCRDFAKGKCSRMLCKYYHVPLFHPSTAALVQQAAPLLRAPAVVSITS